MEDSLSFSVDARPFDFPYNGRIGRASLALLVIDVQHDFLSPDGYFARKGYDPRPLRAVIPVIKKIVDAARECGCQVIWTRQGYRADLADLTDYERWRHEQSGIVFDGSDADGVLVRGTRGYEIVAELAPLPGEPVIDKTANNAFYQTDLDMILRTGGVRHLIFTGCTTDACVHSTLREANDRKFQCLLVEDACASGDAEAHRAAVRMVTLENGIHGAVADSRAVIAGLRTFAERWCG